MKRIKQQQQYHNHKMMIEMNQMQLSHEKRCFNQTRMCPNSEYSPADWWYFFVLFIFFFFNFISSATSFLTVIKCHSQFNSVSISLYIKKISHILLLKYIYSWFYMYVYYIAYLKLKWSGVMTRYLDHWYWWYLFLFFNVCFFLLFFFYFHFFALMFLIRWQFNWTVFNNHKNFSISYNMLSKIWLKANGFSQPINFTVSGISFDQGELNNNSKYEMILNKCYDVKT